MGTVDLVDLRKSYGLIEIMHGIDITIALDEFHGCPYQGPGGGPGKGHNHIGLAEEHVGDRQGTDRDRLASGTSEAFGAGKAVAPSFRWSQRGRKPISLSICVTSPCRSSGRDAASLSRPGDWTGYNH